uniref:CBS domain-containing protein n=1 Tax=Geoglobus ahangari TaxID=113653 RepID=A0A7C4W291_9EURY
MTVKIVKRMRDETITAPPHATVREVANLMKEYNVGCVIITQMDAPVGIITDRDIVVRVVAEGKSLDTPVEEVMTRNIVVAHENDQIRDVIKIMREKSIRRIPVIDDNGNLSGIVTFDDIFVELADEIFNLSRIPRAGMPPKPY